MIIWTEQAIVSKKMISIGDRARAVSPVLGPVFAVLILTVTPLRSDDIDSQLKEIRAALPALDRRIAGDADNVELYSQRGDAYFILGEFDAAVRDYHHMVTLDPDRDASHWRRGIAWFYAGEFDKAAGQFERYHSFDNIDRENGIWRYLCQLRAHGVETARRGLLQYEKDDREPFPDVYRLFSGDIAPNQILERIDQAGVGDLEREKRLFYAHLYIGLWHAVHDRPQQARPHLQKSVDNRWAPAAGYGPGFMWHVGRLHCDRLPPPETPRPAPTD